MILLREGLKKYRYELKFDQDSEEDMEDNVLW